MTFQLSDSFSREKLQEAKKVVASYLRPSPCRRSRLLSELLEGEVYLKLENLQLTGSYKIRGAINRFNQLKKEEKQKGIIACSAGNHAQGVAMAAKIFGVQVTVVMPKLSPLTKIEGARRLGARVVLEGLGFDEAFQAMEKIRQKEDLILIHPFDDKEIIQGQSTVGQEIFDELPEVDNIIVPVGGGGLASGVGLAKHFFAPKKGTHLFGVEVDLMPAMAESLKAQKITKVPWKATIAEGISVSQVSQRTFELVRRFFDRVEVVSEAEIFSSMVTILGQEKTLCEGSGAVGYALLQGGHLPLNVTKGKTSVVVLTGGNIDLGLVARVIERELQKEGLRSSLSIMAPDTPGSMAKIASVIAQGEANILEVFHHRGFSEVSLRETQIDVVIECRGPSHRDKIVSALEKFFWVR